MNRIKRRIDLALYPLKNGDILYGDSFEFFVVGPSIEKVMHGILDREGSYLFHRWDGKDTYRLTITNQSMDTYYVCRSEVLVKTVGESYHGSGFEWKERSQPRRLLKDNIHNMILEGRLSREKTYEKDSIVHYVRNANYGRLFSCAYQAFNEKLRKRR